MDDPVFPLPFDDEAIAAVYAQAGRALGRCAGLERLVLLIAWPRRSTDVAPRSSGWFELGRIADPEGRFWWLVLWHPERAEGRLLRYRKRAPRGSLGEVLPQGERDRRARQGQPPRPRQARG